MATEMRMTLLLVFIAGLISSCEKQSLETIALPYAQLTSAEVTPDGISVSGTVETTGKIGVAEAALTWIEPHRGDVLSPALDHPRSLISLPFRTGEEFVHLIDRDVLPASIYRVRLRILLNNGEVVYSNAIEVKTDKGVNTPWSVYPIQISGYLGDNIGDGGNCNPVAQIFLEGNDLMMYEPDKGRYGRYDFGGKKFSVVPDRFRPPYNEEYFWSDGQTVYFTVDGDTPGTSYLKSRKVTDFIDTEYLSEIPKVASRYPRTFMFRGRRCYFGPAYQLYAFDESDPTQVETLANSTWPPGGPPALPLQHLATEDGLFVVTTGLVRGTNDGKLQIEIFQLDPVTFRWQKRTEYPGTTSTIPFFSGEKGALLLGFVQAGEPHRNNDLWVYRTERDSWEMIGYLPMTDLKCGIEQPVYVGGKHHLIAQRKGSYDEFTARFLTSNNVFSFDLAELVNLPN